jgi:hypothetical protein
MYVKKISTRLGTSCGFRPPHGDSGNSNILLTVPSAQETVSVVREMVPMYLLHTRCD